MTMLQQVQSEIMDPVLPLELIVMILKSIYCADPSQYLTYLANGESEVKPLETHREHLKKLRLEGRVFCEAVSPAIFSSIHIHASTLSIWRAEQIAQSPLANFVEEIVCHEGSFFKQSIDRKDFSKVLYSHTRRQDYPWRKADIHKLEDEFFSNYLEEIQAASKFQEYSIDAYWQPIFKGMQRRFLKLKTMIAPPYQNEWNDPETSSYCLRRVGLSYLPTPKQWPTCKWFVDVMQGWVPQVMMLSLFSNEVARHFLQSQLEMAQAGQKPERLTRLRIGPCFNPKSVYSPLSFTADMARYGFLGANLPPTAKITKFLTYSENLVELELTNDLPHNRTSPVIPPGILPNLTHLKISAGLSVGAWLPYSLYKCISNLPALKHLELDGIRLITNNWSDMPAHRRPRATDPSLSSLVIFTWQLWHKTKLASCSGLSTVRDYKDDVPAYNHVVSGNKPGKEVICRKIEECLCGKRQWPRFMTDAPNSEEGIAWTERAEVRNRAFRLSNWMSTVDEFDSLENRIKSAPVYDSKEKMSKSTVIDEYHQGLRDLL